MALILSAALTLPAAVFALEESGEEELPGNVTETETVTEAESGTEETEEAAGDPAEEIPGEPADETPAEPMAEPGFLQNLTIEENPTGTVEIRWDAYDGAAWYEVTCAGINGGEAVRTESVEQSFPGLSPDCDYDFVITAYSESGEVIAQGAISIKTVAYSTTFDESKYRVLGDKAIKPKKRLKGNLTSMIKEKNSGYAVVQGGCTDGTYAYYLMVSNNTQKGRILKVRIKNNKVAARSKVLNTWHGNGMTYDSKRKKLVVIAREHRKQEITVIDASTLKVTRQENVRYDHYAGADSDSLSNVHQQQGLAAIAYVKKYDCYIALERVYHNLLIFDPETFEAIGMAYTDFTDKYPGTFQAMDADEKYVYLVLSAYSKDGKNQPYNLVLALDWNSENLLPVVNASKSKDPDHVEKAWSCSNDGSGRPDAVIRVRTKYEAENIYHTTDSNGKEHFYLSEYYGHGIYKTVIKRVKVNGRWKKKKVKVLKYYKRDNYVYDLGVI